MGQTAVLLIVVAIVSVGLQLGITALRNAGGRWRRHRQRRAEYIVDLRDEQAEAPVAQHRAIEPTDA